MRTRSSTASHTPAHHRAGRTQRRPGRTARWLAVAVVCCLGAREGLATTVVPLPDETLLEISELVVHGKVLNLQAAPRALTQPASDYLVQVERSLKGPLPGLAIVVRVPGGVHADGYALRLLGMPTFDVGDEVLLFLNPRRDGTFGLVHHTLGAFHMEREGSRKVAFRDLSEVRLQPWPGKAMATTGRRDLGAFLRWIEERAEGRESEQDYFLGPEAGEAGPKETAHPEKFMLNRSSNEPPPLGCGSNGGNPVRWPRFDTAQPPPLVWFSHVSGQPGLPAGGGPQFQRALEVWSGDPHTPVQLTYGGLTTASSGFQARDGANTLLFGDPNNLLDGPFVEGGILAMGGHWFSCLLTEHDGQSFHSAIEGDIVLQNGIGAFLLATGDPRGSAEELFAHELGHTLGFAHSDDPDALMFALIHADGRGPSLVEDDLAGLKELYGDPTQQLAAPSAPTDLRGLSPTSRRIRLLWQDPGKRASTFHIERRIDGAFRRVGSAAGESARFLDLGLEPESTYTYRITAINAAGRSAPSRELSVSTGEDLAPATPSNLRAAPLSPSRVRLSWQDNADDETELQLELQSVGPYLVLPVSLPADTTELNLSGLDPDTDYRFRLRAINAFGTSATSRPATLRTPPVDSRCSVDDNFICLQNGRFRLRVVAEDGLASAIPNSDLSAFFRLPGEDEISLAVRMVDGKELNGYTWFFLGGTTAKALAVVVEDLETGGQRTWSLREGEPCAISDLRAFPLGEPRNDSSSGQTAKRALPPDLRRLLVELPGAEPLGWLSHSVNGLAAQAQVLNGVPSPAGPEGGQSAQASPSTRNLEPCQPTAELLCLGDGRFQAEVEWLQGTANGDEASPTSAETRRGQAVFATPQTGFFWLSQQANNEVVVQVLDRRAETGFFSAAVTVLSRQEIRLTITDRMTGRVWTYYNPSGQSCGRRDPEAFADLP